MGWVSEFRARRKASNVGKTYNEPEASTEDDSWIAHRIPYDCDPITSETAAGPTPDGYYRHADRFYYDPLEWKDHFPLGSSPQISTTHDGFPAPSASAQRLRPIKAEVRHSAVSGSTDPTVPAVHHSDSDETSCEVPLFTFRPDTRCNPSPRPGDDTSAQNPSSEGETKSGDCGGDGNHGEGAGGDSSTEVADAERPTTGARSGRQQRSSGAQRGRPPPPERAKGGDLRSSAVWRVARYVKTTASAADNWAARDQTTRAITQTALNAADSFLSLATSRNSFLDLTSAAIYMAATTALSVAGDSSQPGDTSEGPVRTASTFATCTGYLHSSIGTYNVVTGRNGLFTTAGRGITGLWSTISHRSNADMEKITSLVGWAAGRTTDSVASTVVEKPETPQQCTTRGSATGVSFPTNVPSADRSSRSPNPLLAPNKSCLRRPNPPL